MVTGEETVEPNETEHDVGEGDLNETELRTEPENLSGTQTWSGQIRTACWEKGISAHYDEPYSQNNFVT